MNKETVNLPRLISEISAGASVDPASARRFIHELFVLLESSLQADETVKIKGIGTFVRSDDSEQPVLFKADEELAAFANEPFAAFTAVELNDGAAEEIMNTQTVEAAVPETIQSSMPVNEPSEPICENSVRQENVDVHEDDKEEYVEEKEISEDEEQIPPSEPVSESAPIPGLPPVPEPEPLSEPAIEPQLQAQPIVRESNGNTSMWLVLGILIGLILGLVCGYFAGETMANFKLPDEDEEDLDTVELYEPEAISTPVEAIVKPAEAKLEQSEPQPVLQTKSKPAEPVYDTITKTRYLSILAKEHYGSKKYWVFIYNANPHLGDPNKVSPGTRVLIPAKESFMEATQEATDAKAQRLLNQLARKYKL